MSTKGSNKSSGESKPTFQREDIPLSGGPGVTITNRSGGAGIKGSSSGDKGSGGGGGKK